MRSSSTSRSCSAIGLCLALTLTSAVAAADEPAAAARALSQYVRDEWGADRGFPGGPVHGIAQSADGYLWIAAEKGLVRFDGLTFELFRPAGAVAGAGPTVLGVAVDADGGVWARLRGPALVRHRRGGLELMNVAGERQGPVITAMARAADGAVLFAPLGRSAMVYRGGRFHAITTASTLGSSFVLSIAQTPSGVTWLGTRDAGLVRIDGDRVTPVIRGLPDTKINCLLAGRGDEVLIGTDRGVARWAGGEVTTAGVPQALAAMPVLAMIRDRASNLWIAAGPRGLLRVSGDRVSSLADPPARSGPPVTDVFEDRDGNIWFATPRGIGRLRDTLFTTYTTTQGLPSESMGPVYADASGRVWFAPSEGGLYRLEGSRVQRVVEAGLRDDVVYSIAGRGEDVWVGRQQGGLARIRPRGDRLEVTRYTQSDGLAQNNVFAVHVARDGAVWAGTLSAGVSRFKDGVFTTYTVSDGLPSNTVAAIVDDAGGTIWFGTPNGLSAFARGRWQRVTREHGLPSNDVNALVEDSAGGLWVGTAGGLSYVRDGRVQPTGALPASLTGPILDLVEDRAGWLWVATADGFLRVHRQRLVAGTLGPGDVQEFAAADGLSGPEGVKRQRSVALDPLGRVWFATNRGLSSADSARAAQPAVLPQVHVAGIAADGAPVAIGETIEVAPGAQRVVVTYAGLNLSAPERLRFRYRLDGFDRDWGPPVAERQAVYTNLAPGSYTFRVVASNGDGVWSGGEASMAFGVRPQPWQTSWFRAAVVMLAALAGWGLYRLRVRQLAHELHLRFDERLAERTRIAQELHDTLLQGFMSASMQLHVAAERLPEGSPAKTSVARVLDLMSRVIDEGRNAVRGLRSPASAPIDLEGAFASIPQELDGGAGISYRVIVEGQPRPLAPAIREEVYRIGREALTNAFRHSDGSHVELELDYAPGGLTLLVRDDGRGIDARVVASGTDGHWGLPGMRERAERVGARFTVSTRVAAGTEVALHIPGAVAYLPDTGHRRRTWPWLRGRTAAAGREEEETRP